MLENLGIKNFKSSKDLTLNCKRVNLFIGEPNTGKSNILEAIGLLSHAFYGRELKHFVRFEIMTNMFYDNILQNDVTISFDKETVDINFRNGSFVGLYSKEEGRYSAFFNYDYHGSGSRNVFGEFSRFKFFRFSPKESFPDQRSEFLYPPHGDNLLVVILTRKELRVMVRQLFEKFGLRPVFDPPKGG